MKTADLVEIYSTFSNKLQATGIVIQMPDHDNRLWVFLSETTMLVWYQMKYFSVKVIACG